MQTSTNPSVSVIIPCYNGAEYIVSTIESVLNQAYEDFELIVIDDGSTDQTSEEINRVQDKRLKYFRTENQGVSHARNYGIRESNGEFIALLDADDLYLETNLKQKIQFLNNHKDIGLVHGSEMIFESVTETTKSITKGLDGFVLPELLSLDKKVIHSPSSVVFRKKLIDQAGSFDEQMSVAADWDMWVRLARITNFGFIDKPLTKYRLHQNQMHSNISAMEKDMIYAFKKLEHERVWNEVMSKKTSKAKLFLTLGLCFIKDEPRYLRAIKYLLKSFVTSPQILFTYLRRKF